MALLYLLPMALHQPALMCRHVLISTAALPLSFAYSILPATGCFGLDALMRRVLLRGSGTAVVVALFFLPCRACGSPADDTEAAITGAGVASFFTPALAQRTTRLIDRGCTLPFQRVLGARASFDADSPSAIGGALAQRVRQLVPTGWAACVVSRMQVEWADWQLPSSWRRWADAVPGWPARLRSESLVARSSVVPIGAPSDWSDCSGWTPRRRLFAHGARARMMQVLARDVAALIDAALAARARRGQGALLPGRHPAHDTISPPRTVQDIRAAPAEHAVKLLKADSIAIWRCSPAVQWPSSTPKRRPTERAVSLLLATTTERDSAWSLSPPMSRVGVHVGLSTGVPTSVWSLGPILLTAQRT